MTAAISNDQIAAYIAATNGISRAAAQRILTDTFDFIRDSVGQGETIHIKGFGKFSTTIRSERQGINPKTMEPITIPATAVVKFKAMAGLKDEVKQQ